jgi:hypothetical protein
MNRCALLARFTLQSASCDAGQNLRVVEVTPVGTNARTRPRHAAHQFSDGILASEADVIPRLASRTRSGAQVLSPWSAPVGAAVWLSRVD